MAIPNTLRDRLITEFRQRLCEELDVIPFIHQADWWATTDGYDLSDVVLREDDVDRPSMLVRTPTDAVERRLLLPRPEGRAKVVALLGAYKSGKSWSAGLWAAAFAAVPEAKVYLVGNVYDMCAPEFEYIVEFLLSDRGLSLKPKTLQNRPKDGRMWLELQNGARFEARSWESSESLKGKEVDAYCYCEAYQLPGIECFTSVRQNLRARSGYAIFPTTPDRPWVSVLHQNGHGEEPSWVCRCNVPSSANPVTFDQAIMDSDRKLMTREKFQIAHEGQLGNYIGSVFDYQRGTREFTLSSHPELWHNKGGSPVRENFRLPSDWKVVIGADTGTFMAATYIAISPNGDAFILDELANFTYIANEPETDPAMSVMGWAESFKRKAALYKTRPTAWVDSNSQFKVELAHYGIGLMSNPRGREVRTEAARQYFQHKKVFLAPWLKLLPYELENARWPDRTTTSGRFERMKENDHVLDGMEHVFSRHPRARKRQETQPDIPGYTEPPPRRRLRPGSAYDPHLGGM